MTSEILYTDIECARELLNKGRSDELIIKALSLRGVAPAAAATLLTGLRNGEKMRPDMILLPRYASQRAQAG